ncbi:MAG: hypothetical protein GC154_18600 [bacterium]|nr:hypothetical protein [bacterium]
MKAGIEIVGVFERRKDEHGNEHFAGSLDPAAFKKAKREIKLILMKGDLLPASLVGKCPASLDSLYMFSRDDSEVA